MATPPSNSAASAESQQLIVISYNMHGFNQGSHGIKELIDKLSPSIMLVQEHWLTPDNLDRLNSLSDDYFVFGSSAMNATVCSGPLIGRPFGGTAVIINKNIISLTTNIVSCDRFTVVKIADWLFVSVYLPCVGSIDRDLLYCEILSEIEALIVANNNCHCCIAGDFNTNLNNNSTAASVTVNDFIRCNNLSRCDILFPSANRFTYVNESTNTASVIDYILTSSPNRIITFNVLDIDINLSDHLPIMAICTADIKGDQITSPGVHRSDDVTHLRWDHARIDLYYEQSRQLLQPILVELNNLKDLTLTLMWSGGGVM